MDDARFDAWMRALAGAGSRRGVIQTLTAGAIGLAVSRLGLGEAAARKRRRKKKRKNRCPDARRCGQRCCRKGDRCVDPAAETCVTGRGSCAAGADSCEVGGGGIQCNPDSPITCTCNRTMEGATACVNQLQNASCTDCTTDAECQLPGKPPGMRCVELTFNCACGSFTSVCAPPCPKPS